MDRLIKMTLLIFLLLILSSVLLCITVPTFILFKSFLTTIGVLLIATIWLILIGEVSKLVDLKHRNKTQQALREIELQKQRQQHLQQRRVVARSRGYYH
jgi:multisubunit Na+/H+ antiporter MnhG subunit